MFERVRDEFADDEAAGKHEIKIDRYFIDVKEELNVVLFFLIGMVEFGSDAFYIFPDASAYYGKKFNGLEVNDSVSFCKFMLEEMKIALVPGGAFGDDKCFRFSYAASMENIKKGLDRFEEGLKKLQ